MKRYLPLTALLILFITVPVTFSATQTCNAQTIPILGYPYETNGGESSGASYSYYGQQFTLNGDATIISITAKLRIGYNWTHPNAVSHFRYAIYGDNNGSFGSLIAQTELGSGTCPINGYQNQDKWRTLNLLSPVSLHPGNYWLISVDDSQQVTISNAQPIEKNSLVHGGLDSMDFPETLNDEVDNAPEMLAIYASGKGESSVLPQIAPPDQPTPSRVFLSFRSVDSSTGKFQIVGNLTSNNTAIAMANMTFSYRTSNESESSLHQFSTITTDSEGYFTIDWLPPGAGSYVINATYHGSDLYGAVFDGINVLVSEFNGDKEVFSVESNSTVTSIVFDPQSSELNLSVIGQTGTTGFVDVYVSKSLVGNVSAIQAYIDGKPIDYTVSSTEDSWILHFNYHHSSHNIVFNISKATTAVPEIPTVALPITIVSLAAVAAMLIILQKRHGPGVLS